MPVGNPRPPVAIDTQIGGFIIKARTEKKHGRKGDNEEYYYTGECIACGALATKRLHQFRKHHSHYGCPAMKLYKREVALKNMPPGKFDQFMKERYQM